MSLEARLYCRKTGNDIYTLPANTTHILQPYDVGVARPFNHYLAEGIAKIRLGQPDMAGRSIDTTNIMKAVRYAVGKVTAITFNPSTAENESTVISAFRKAGLHPWNPSVVDPSMYAPAADFDSRVTSKRPAPTPEMVLAAVDKHTVTIEAGDVDKLLEKAVAATKRAHCVPEMTLLTGDECVIKAAQLALSRAAAADALEERKKERTAKIEARKVEKAADDAARELRKAEKAAVAKRKLEASAAPRNVRARTLAVESPSGTGGEPVRVPAVVRAPGKRAVVATPKARRGVTGKKIGII